MTTVEPEGALESPVDGSIAGSKGRPLFLTRYEHPNAQYTLVLVHGTAGYSAAYHDFAEQFRRRFPATVWAFDLTGHGRTPGPRGVFTFDDFLEDVRAVADHAAERTGVPVVLHGASQGGEIAFHALARCPRVAGAVCMNILLNDELQMNRAIRLMRSPTMDRLARGLGDRVRVPLRRVIDFKAAYQEDPGLLPEKLIDPLNVWSYGFKSYHSVFNYKPHRTLCGQYQARPGRLRRERRDRRPRPCPGLLRAHRRPKRPLRDAWRWTPAHDLRDRLV